MPPSQSDECEELGALSGEWSFDQDRLYAELLTRINVLGMTGTVEIGNIPKGALDFWPYRTSDRIVATGPQRDHWRLQHPELVLELLEVEMIRAALDPDSIHRGQHDDRPATAIFMRQINDGYDIAVVVSVATQKSLSNSVITARKQNRRIRLRREKRFEIWKREEK
jgi:hypothetical protein